MKAERNRLDELIRKAEEIQNYISWVRSRMEPEPMKNFEGGSSAIFSLSLPDAVAILIKGAPATTKEILDLLKSHGRFVGGKKPLVTLYSALTRSKVIRRLPDKKWGSLL